MTYESLVEEEVKKQEQMWGEQNNDPPTWVALFAIEVDILRESVLGVCVGAPSFKATFEKEIILIAAGCKAMWESMKRNGYI